MEKGDFYAPRKPPTLEEYLRAPRTFEEKVKICRGIMDGIKYLQAKRVLHGALSPQNIFIGKNALIGNFTQATVYSDAPSDPRSHIEKD